MIFKVEAGVDPVPIGLGLRLAADAGPCSAGPGAVRIQVGGQLDVDRLAGAATERDGAEAGRAGRAHDHDQPALQLQL